MRVTTFLHPVVEDGDHLIDALERYERRRRVDDGRLYFCYATHEGASFQSPRPSVMRTRARLPSCCTTRSSSTASSLSGSIDRIDPHGVSLTWENPMPGSNLQ